VDPLQLQVRPKGLGLGAVVRPTEDKNQRPLKPGETAQPDTRTGTAKAKPRAVRPASRGASSSGKHKSGPDAESIMPAGKSKAAKGWAKAKPKANEKPKSKRADPKKSGGKSTEGKRDADRRRRP